MTFQIDGLLKETGDQTEIEMTGLPEDEEYPLDCRFHEPVKLRATATKLGDGIALKGTLQACLDVQCSRCLKDMVYPLETEIDAVFQKENSEDGYLYEGDILPLDKMLLDAISFEIPVQYLCKKDCKGLCPRCGADLNTQTCGCSAEEVHRENPFEKLKGLFD